MLSGQIPWATSLAARAQASASMDEEDDHTSPNGKVGEEEGLLAALLQANEELVGVLRQYDDLRRLYVEMKLEKERKREERREREGKDGKERDRDREGRGKEDRKDKEERREVRREREKEKEREREREKEKERTLPAQPQPQPPQAQPQSQPPPSSHPPTSHPHLFNAAPHPHPHHMNPQPLALPIHRRPSTHLSPTPSPPVSGKALGGNGGGKGQVQTPQVQIQTQGQGQTGQYVSYLDLSDGGSPVGTYGPQFGQGQAGGQAGQGLAPPPAAPFGPRLPGSGTLPSSGPGSAPPPSSATGTGAPGVGVGVPGVNGLTMPLPLSTVPRERPKGPGGLPVPVPRGTSPSPKPSLVEEVTPRAERFGGLPPPSSGQGYGGHKQTRSAGGRGDVLGGGGGKAPYGSGIANVAYQQYSSQHPTPPGQHPNPNQYSGQPPTSQYQCVGYQHHPRRDGYHASTATTNTTAYSDSPSRTSSDEDEDEEYYERYADRSGGIYPNGTGRVSPWKKEDKEEEEEEEPLPVQPSAKALGKRRAVVESFVGPSPSSADGETNGYHSISTPNGQQQQQYGFGGTSPTSPGPSPGFVIHSHASPHSTTHANGGEGKFVYDAMVERTREFLEREARAQGVVLTGLGGEGLGPSLGTGSAGGGSGGSGGSGGGGSRR